MSDRRLLEDLDPDAPPPRPGLADEVLAAAGRRRRRLWAISGASAAAVLVAVAIPIAVQLTRNDTSPAGGGPGVVGDSTSGPPGRPAHPPSTIVGIYVAALEKTAASATSGQGTQPVEVRSSTCDNLNPPNSQTCGDPQPIPAQTRQQVLSRLPSANRVRFVPGPSTDPPGSRHVLFVTLGPVESTGNQVRIFVQTWCGFNCVRGNGLLLNLRGGQWRVTGEYAGYLS